MKKGLDYAKGQVQEFHEAFGHPVANTPTAIEPKLAVARTIWTAEELVEFLYATANNDKELFGKLMAKLYNGIEAAEQKVLNSGAIIENPLVDQMDALTDVNYFVQGSFVVAGVNPQPLFDIVQDANMAKLWEDGKPRYDENNGGKIKKPEGWEAPEPKLLAEIKKQMKEVK
jgi:energy-coupling factor transport system permease protein